MIYQRDIATKCKFLLGQWKENLNLTNYERTKFEDTLNQLDFQINKLENKLTKLKGNLAKAVPLKRTGLPEDIANAAIYLASDAGNFITCQDIIVDGGRTGMFEEPNQ